MKKKTLSTKGTKNTKKTTENLCADFDLFVTFVFLVDMFLILP